MSDALVVVGIGNPGQRYVNTRHNVGVDAVEVLCERHGERLRPDKKIPALTADVTIGGPGGTRVHCAFPTTFMNESGRSVAALLRRHEIDSWSQLVIVHDELDLEPGRIKVKLGGGLAGHNGLRSVTAHLHTQDYARIRIGVGRPPGGAGKGADWVLSKVPSSARAELDIGVITAVDAIEKIATSGLDAAMQHYNQAG